MARGCAGCRQKYLKARAAAQSQQTTESADSTLSATGTMTRAQLRRLRSKMGVIKKSEEPVEDTSTESTSE